MVGSGKYSFVPKILTRWYPNILALSSLFLTQGARVNSSLDIKGIVVVDLSLAVIGYK